MFGKLKEMKEQMDMLNSLQSGMGNMDMSNPEAMLESMGINMEDIENHFNQINFNEEFEKIPLRYINDSENNNPEYAYESDSGFDLRSTEDIWVQANDRKLIPTGLRFDIPLGYEIQVRSKSGLALNQGLMVLNSPGTVDSGYQGEVKVIIFNTTNERIKIEKGQKIAQAVLCPVMNGKWVDLVRVEEIGEKDRNDKGFGSTGLK
jgi:dUTP pyrophosphatase